METSNRKHRKIHVDKRTAIIIASVVVVIIAAVFPTKEFILPQIKYSTAIAKMDAGNTTEAYEALIALDGYKDSAEIAASIYDKYKLEKLKNISVGESVFFGAYEQDNNPSNGKEDIEWIVLDMEDNRALLISKYAIDCKPYNTENSDVTWQTCSLRAWLNSDFMDAAFSDEEKAVIPTVTVSADASPAYPTDPGEATQDQVFLLSLPEANEYFSSNKERECKLTYFSYGNGVYLNDTNGNCWWWLRTPGHEQKSSSLINTFGAVSDFGFSVNSTQVAVRPVLWIIPES